MRNNENSFKTIAKTSSSSSYLGFTILLCKYGLPYLPTLPQKKLSKLFFLKKFGSKIPYLPTVWTYVQSFVVFLFGTLSLAVYSISPLPPPTRNSTSTRKNNPRGLKFCMQPPHTILRRESQIKKTTKLWTYVQTVGR